MPTVSPDVWSFYGHSLAMAVPPSGDQLGRIDGMFRSAMDVEPGNWRNFAFSGARVSGSGRNLGGWARLMSTRGNANRSGPYTATDGAAVLLWGINDMGMYGGQNANVRQTIIDALRACISRCRAATVHENDNTSRFSYGAGWVNIASGLDVSSGGSTRQCTTTTNATITYTLPSDYRGEPVALGFLKRPGGTGGTVTFSGTALSGHPDDASTLYVGDGGQYFTEHAYTVKRITGLTSVNAGDTITITTTGLDASSPSVFFDCAWLESFSPPAVVMCDVMRLTAAGYNNAFYNTWNGSGSRSEAAMDADVNALNTALASMVAEFDSMVQIAACDAEIDKNPNLTSDGIHPNEVGAGLVVDAIVDAVGRLSPPPSASGYTLSFNGSAPRAGAVRRPHRIGWHAPDLNQAAYSTLAVPASGTMYALAFDVTEGREEFMNLGLEVTTAGTAGATIRWGIYEDVVMGGYPGALITGMDTTTSAALSTGTTAGLVQSAALNIGIGFHPDPGLFWLVLKVDTAGTGQSWRSMTGQSAYMPTRSTTGTGSSFYAGWSITGQGTGALPGSFPAGASLATSVPLVQIKRSK